jgi:hypothetical protein
MECCIQGPETKMLTRKTQRTAKLSFRNKGEIKAFFRQEKFISTKLALQEMLEGVLC